MIFLSACESRLDPLMAEIRGAATKISLMLFVPPAAPGLHVAGSSALQAATAGSGSTKRVAMKAIKDVDVSFRTFRNESFGKFTGQVTVAFNSLVGLTDGQSLGFLEFRQPKFRPTPRRIFVGAVYDASITGLRAVVADEDGNAFGTPIPFSNAHEVDLRIEQTATQLIFSARATPADQSSGGWQPVHTIDEAPASAGFHLHIGIRKLKKLGVAFFSNFALDGDAIGGTLEYPVIVELRAAVEAIRAAQAKIVAVPANLPGASGDLAAAITAHDNALAKLQNDVFRMQTLLFAREAQSSLQKLTDDLAAAKTAVDSGTPSKAAAQVAKLNTVAGAELAAMANLLGCAAPNLKTAPALFSLRIP